MPPHRPEIAAVAPAVPYQLTYNNGTLLSAVQVCTVFWGTAWQQGESIRRVAQELGTPYETIRRLLKSRGIVLEPQEAAMTALQQEEALGLVRQGESLQHIARTLGLSSQSLRRLVKSKGVIPTDQQLRLTLEQQQEVLYLVRQGVSLREVSEQFGVAHQTIRKIVKPLKEGAESGIPRDT